ncbi:MAG: hypothetical protein AAB687_02145 [Patescibacteria group bacterium]
MEVLILVAVLGLIVLIVLPQFSKIRENQVLKNAVGDVLSSINKARGQTLSSLDSSEYGVHFQANKVIIFKGTAYSAISPDNEMVNIVTPASISNISLSGGGSDVYFSRLLGAPSKTGTVTISSTSYNRIITISATGVASSN